MHTIGNLPPVPNKAVQYEHNINALSIIYKNLTRHHKHFLGYKSFQVRQTRRPLGQRTILPQSPTMLLPLFILLLLHISRAEDQDLPFYVQTPVPCGRTCKFKLCFFRQKVTIGAPNVVQHVPICRFGDDLREILQVGEASIAKKGYQPVPISQWRPPGLDVPFEKSFFGVGEDPGRDNPSLFTRKVQGNQYRKLSDTCVVLPIQKYTVGRDGLTKTKLGKANSDCLSFLVKTAEIIIELEWFSGDDLDLSVREPDGTIVNFRNLRSACGKLQLDNCVDCCGIFEVARERVIYKRSCEAFQNGDYTAIIRHSSNCGMGPTKWKLRLIEDGVVTKFTKGETNTDAGKFAGRMKFKL